jgi:CHU_C Type IX secretion signal domain
VTDNQQFSFTITAASSQAGNSGFATANAGGAVSSTSNNNNRTEVIASTLRFVQEPSNTFVNEVMSPAVAVEAVDVNGNLDLDFSGSLNLTSQGSLSFNPTISITSGAGTSSDIIFSAAGTALTLTTTNSFSLANATSAPFDIYEDTEGIELIINSFITPNTADDQNNVLYIENIEFFPENTVKLIDRWGVPIKSWTNFTNYNNSDAEQADFDFNSLSIGNYICIVEYKNSKDGNNKSQTQMISVLK